ncbi:hypothetical protein [Microbispora catharanthi]|uniref:Intein C-terminal splicing domain-containing protein n=1 Tax=Microbispora catharanthi TaxID=1712871 RepID=A0A5N6C4E6_9ACTN|nr:hypothetical protein [Microbispora catharanthi]KAB8187611.1 hypothetical protein FH610_000035 [Microbispora catharanthi]
MSVKLIPDRIRAPLAFRALCLIDGPHSPRYTYYAFAGNAPILVHNAGGEYCNISELKGDEPSTAARLMASKEYSGGQLRGFRDTNNPDFIDARGRTYDAVGGPSAWTNPNYNEGKMIRSIWKHIYAKSGFNYTVLDMTGASSAQIDAVFSSLDSWAANPAMKPLNKLIILGGGY